MKNFDDYSMLSFERRGKVLTIKIDHAEGRNAVNDALHHELSRVFFDAQDDEESDVIVLTGVGKWFCAGGDMNWFQECIDSPAKWRRNVTIAKRITSSLLDVEKPVICRLNGAAAGLGASLALLCDITIAADTAVIGDPHVKMGLVAGDGGIISWPRLVGMARAKEMLLTGRMLSAAEAVALGLINHAVASHELDSKVDALADELASGATWAIRWTKTVMNLELKQSNVLTADAALGYETITNHMRHHQEAVCAFKEKRKPSFEPER
ncbi:enoyl-CoA hydratase/isomerase family protein [Paraburkholderia sediminicola]|uniref:Enoyl-CoA hydratase/isomerase family protein n=1 Tax=Paraburkholderia metrosideri TaxID=580937 RepID=A0ABW9E682_9BURK